MSTARRRREAAATRRVVAPLAVPSRADDFARRQRERRGAWARDNRRTLELAAAIDAGDAGYRRLRVRLDDYGTRLAAVRARLCVGEPARAVR